MPHDPLIFDLPLNAWPIWAQGLFWFWIVVFGASIGSFLNVVIYRAPRGMSLVHPGSHCPKCGHGIRARDNLPVLGWLLLRGKCRDCSADISPRYPLVEALVGAIFLGVVALYLGGKGASLPGMYAGESAVLSERQLVGIAAYHLLLVTLLVAASGMRFDGQTMPRWIVALVVVIGITLPWIWPWLRPLASGLPDQGADGANALIDGILGAGVGWLVGCVRFAPFRSDRAWGWIPAGDRQLYAVVGTMLGWQAVIAVTLVSAALGAVLGGLALRLPRLAKVPDEVGLLLATLLMLISWKWSMSQLAGSDLPSWLFATFAMIVIAALAGWEGTIRMLVRRKLSPAKRKK